MNLQAVWDIRRSALYILFFCNPIVTCKELVYVTRFVGCSLSKDRPQSMLLTRIVVRPLAWISEYRGV